jgi:hypothetical protein
MKQYLNETHKEVLLSALEKYLNDATEKRHMFDYLMDKAIETGEVPEEVRGLYANADVFRHHMADLSEIQLSRQETAAELYGKISVGETTINFDETELAEF